MLPQGLPRLFVKNFENLCGRRNYQSRSLHLTPNLGLANPMFIINW